MSQITPARASKLASSSPKEFDFQYFIYQNEGSYPMWSNFRRIFGWFLTILENMLWNQILCCLALLGLIIVSSEPETYYYMFGIDAAVWLIWTYNVCYGVHCAANIREDVTQFMHYRASFKISRLFFYIPDLALLLLIANFFVNEENVYIINMISYTLRMARPIMFLSGLMHHSLKLSVSSILFTFFYLYIFLLTISTNCMNWASGFKSIYFNFGSDFPKTFEKQTTKNFFSKFILLNKLFLGFGPDFQQENRQNRLLMMPLMLIGKLLVQDFSYATLTIIMAVFNRAQESFRVRFRIIMNDMAHIHLALRNKVETFYRMYWLKQKAVSKTRLMPLFPPTLMNALNADIFFEALQKSRILCDLSYQFLVEISKYMQIIHYVPGDFIIERKSLKTKMVYISYGDVEMLTAEDDTTPILRFTRGSIINPCGGCAEVATTVSHVAIRAATFCTAHVLNSADLWLVCAKYGKTSGQAFILHSAFEDHFEKVKRHYATRTRTKQLSKSSIVKVKRNLIELKGARDPDEGMLLLNRYDMFLEIAGYYIMRNQEDPALRDTSDEIFLRSTFPCVLQPNSSLLIAWNILVAILTVLVVFIYPYNFFFISKVSIHFKFFDLMMTFIYIVDIIVTLSTGTKMEEGVPITLSKTASRQCTNIWFAIDVVSVMPLFYFIDPRFSGLNKALKILKVIHLLKSFEDIFIYSSHSLRFMTYMLAITCTIYLTSANIQFVKCFQRKECVINTTAYPRYWEKGNIDDSNSEKLLLFSLYWGFSFFTFNSHRTDKPKLRATEPLIFLELSRNLILLIRLLLPSIFAAILIISLQLRDEYRICINTVTDFFNKSNVDPILRIRFINYIKLCWFTDKAYSITNDKKTVLFDLPSHVNREILAMQRNKFLLCIPCMKVLQKEVLESFCAQSRLFYTSPNEILQNTGEVINEIYVIRQGICEVLNPVTRQVTNLLGSKDVFGDVECLLRIPAFYTVRAVTHVQMICLNRNVITKALHNPAVINAIRFARQSPEYTQLQYRHSAFLKFEMVPKPPNRQFFVLPRKHEPDIEFQLPFARLGLFSVLRYVFPRFTIRPDGKYMERYELFRCLCAIISALIYPLYTALGRHRGLLFYFCWLLDFTAYFDVVQRMLVAYYDENGILVYHPASTAIHYIKGAFAVDIISCLPLEYLDASRTMMFIDKETNGYRIPATGQYLQFLKLGQLYRVPNALNKLKDYIKREDIVFMIKYFPIFSTFILIMTSFIFETTLYKYSLPNNDIIVRPRPLFTLGEEVMNWVSLYQDNIVSYNITGSPWNAVLTCLYWMTYELTAVGFDVLQPCNLVQIFIMVVGFFIANFLTMFVQVKVLSIRANVNPSLASYQGHIRDIKKYMKRETIPKNLQKTVLSYYDNQWSMTGGINYRTLLTLCDQITLRTDAIINIYGATFDKCPLLKKADTALLRGLARYMLSRYYIKDLNPLHRGQVVSQLLLIDSGTVELRHPDDNNRVVLKLTRGSIFGNLENVPYYKNPSTFVATSKVHVLRIDAQIFYKLVADFPAVKVLFLKLRPNDENYIVGSGSQDDQHIEAWDERGKSHTKLAESNNTNDFMKLLNVESAGVQIYFIIVSLLSIYGELYNMGFQAHTPLYIGILYTLDMCFLVKIVLNIAQPLLNNNNTETKADLITLRKQYIKGEFKCDILSLIPIELCSLAISDHDRIFGILRLNRLLRGITVCSSFSRYSRKLNVNQTISAICFMCIWLSLYIHTCTCIWYLISVFEEEDNKFSSWRYQNSCRIRKNPNIYKRLKNPELCVLNLACDEPHYVCSLYFILCIFTHNAIGDIVPRQQIEVIFIMVFMLSSTIISFVFAGECANIMQFRSFRASIFYDKYLELLDFLQANKVSKNLMEMTKVYTRYLWRETLGYQLPQFAQDLPPCLKLQVFPAAYISHLLGHPTFERCETDFLKHLCTFFQPYLYVENMWVAKDGEITNAMYFVHHGRVLEVDEEMERELDEFTPGTFFGTPHGLTRDLPYTLSYKTVIKSQILTLKYDDWEFLLEHYPISKNKIYRQDDDDRDKKKKKIQITKAPSSVRTIGMSSQNLGTVSGQLSSAKMVLRQENDALQPHIGEQPKSHSAHANFNASRSNIESKPFLQIEDKRKLSDKEGTKPESMLELGYYPSGSPHFKSKENVNAEFENEVKSKPSAKSVDSSQWPQDVRPPESFSLLSSDAHKSTKELETVKLSVGYDETHLYKPTTTPTELSNTRQKMPEEDEKSSQASGKTAEPRRSITEEITRRITPLAQSLSQMLKSYLFSGQNDTGEDKDITPLQLQREQQLESHLKPGMNENKLASGRNINLEPKLLLSKNEIDAKDDPVSFEHEMTTSTYEDAENFETGSTNTEKKMTTLSDKEKYSSPSPTTGSKTSLKSNITETSLDVEGFIHKGHKKKVEEKKSSRLSRSSRKNENESKRSGLRRKEDVTEFSDEETLSRGAVRQRQLKRRRWLCY